VCHTSAVLNADLTHMLLLHIVQKVMIVSSRDFSATLGRFAACYVLWTAIWYIRKTLGDPAALSDLVLFALLEAWLIWSGAPNQPTSLYCLHLASLATLWFVPRFFSDRQVYHHGQHGPHVGAKEVTLPMKPTILQCKTTHSRFFPKKHSFSYSYLYVGIPVGWNGNAGGVLSTGAPGRAWLHVSADDYLQRDSPGHDLRSKLELYLKSQVCRSTIELPTYVAHFSGIPRRNCTLRISSDSSVIFGLQLQPSLLLVPKDCTTRAASDDS